MRNVAVGTASAAALSCAPRRTDMRDDSKTKKPNIIFILADDLGYGDLGCYGQTRIKTPRLDQFAEEGMRFTDAYAGSTVCAPSRCCLMTGMHTGHAWVRGNARIPLRPKDQTVAETLKEQGYRTGIVGKWGLGEPNTTGIPNRQGFDYWFGYLNQRHAHDYYPDYLWRNEERVTLEGNLEKPGTQYTHDMFTEEALQFVEESADQPFFLYLAYTIPHAHNELGRKTGNGMEVPSDEPYTDEKWPQAEKNTAAMITRMDRDVGRLIDKLQDLGIDENTCVIFTSDNGPHSEGGHRADYFESSGPLRGMKRDLYEGGIRVPTLARWPGVVAPGSVNAVPWAFWDFPATAAEIAGASFNPDADGVSILPALKGADALDREYLYWEFYERGFSQAVRMGKWKAVKQKKGGERRTELYDMETDIGETNDIAADHPDMVERIEAVMAGARFDNDNYKAPKDA